MNFESPCTIQLLDLLSCVKHCFTFQNFDTNTTFVPQRLLQRGVHDPSAVKGLNTRRDSSIFVASARCRESRFFGQELLLWGGGSRVSVRGPRGRMFGRATIEGDKCARQGPRRGLLLPRAAVRGNLLLAFASKPRRGMREPTRRGYLHLETGYEHARAF